MLNTANIIKLGVLIISWFHIDSYLVCAHAYVNDDLCMFLILSYNTIDTNVWCFRPFKLFILSNTLKRLIMLLSAF